MSINHNKKMYDLCEELQRRCYYTDIRDKQESYYQLEVWKRHKPQFLFAILKPQLQKYNSTELAERIIDQYEGNIEYNNLNKEPDHE